KPSLYQFDYSLSGNIPTAIAVSDSRPKVDPSRKKIIVNRGTLMLREGCWLKIDVDDQIFCAAVERSFHNILKLSDVTWIIVCKKPGNGYRAESFVSLGLIIQPINETSSNCRDILFSVTERRYLDL